MKAFIRAKLAAGWTEKQIDDHFVAELGPQVLVDAANERLRPARLAAAVRDDRVRCGGRRRRRARLAEEPRRRVAGRRQRRPSRRCRRASSSGSTRSSRASTPDDDRQDSGRVHRGAHLRDHALRAAARARATSRPSPRSRWSISASAARAAASSPRASRSSPASRSCSCCSAPPRRRSRARSTRRPRPTIAGFILVVLGLAFVGLLPWPERTVVPGLATHARRTGSAVLLGGAFAIVAAPCIGTVLASILVLASSSGGVVARHHPPLRLLARPRRRVRARRRRVRPRDAGVPLDPPALPGAAHRLRRDPDHPRAAALLQPRLVAADRARPAVPEGRSCTPR